VALLLDVSFTDAATTAFFGDHVIDLGHGAAGMDGLVDLSFMMDLPRYHPATASQLVPVSCRSTSLLRSG
jgi:hypothetical protein